MQFCNFGGYQIFAGDYIDFDDLQDLSYSGLD